MKKIIIIVLIAFLPASGIAQSIFDQYEDRENVGTVVVSKGMFKMLASMMDIEGDSDAAEFKELAQNIDGLKVFMTEDKGAMADMKVTVDKYLKSSSLEELLRVKDEDTNVRFYVKYGKDDSRVSELLMFVTGLNDSHVHVDHKKFETVLLTLTGDIELSKIGMLTDKMDLPKDLKKAKKQ
ncbi:MAG: DUF4252 domain-containing protein [Saonia sp.]